MGTFEPDVHSAILVVDDDEDSRTAMRAILEDGGYSVLEASDGSDALDLLHSGGASGISAVVLDLMMPRVSGWEFLEILRNDASLCRIPVLVATAMPVHGDASGIGATMFWLRKPFGSTELLTAVESCAVVPE